MLRFIITVFGLSLLYSTNVNAFKFDSDLQNPKNSDPAHEKITGLAYDCVLVFNGEEPSNCIESLDFPKDRGIDSDTYYPNVSINPDYSIPFTREEIYKAVSWPDDPARELQFKTALKPAISFLRTCGDRKLSIRGGLFCNSHFGQLQYPPVSG
ncbi:hypothetical protein A3740_19260 [Oleiphilus sp. HI0068]|uniref:hypothetical protein n=1 Tax=Oleiphilus sp. HI0132 TaxID=1822270 RepID=UPI0007C2179F|nr:hypothetical protein [Oleiphilus sp. HI0132]KZY73303.1 hypothetical protein A3740_19260 [Oleiphilus sp. HI0068]KZY80646.1 hypothetical protein A3741_18470 [Oleiphilus sp. HI0069]KZZ43513.1 hypothetical protein A3755_21435 [Oleiphilus sp. HI0085]KZZ76112.1 hypothetical protein A3766_14935 [Oleiphilus sp. HI0132]